MNGKFGFAVIFWIITILIIGLIILPIYLNVGEQYQFYIENIIYITLFVTFTRFIFFTRYHWFSHNAKVKTALVFIVIPIFFYLMDSLYDFQAFMDQEGVNSILTGLSVESQNNLARFIETEMLLFWVGAMITSLMLPFRMIHSIWRLKHRGKV